MLEFWFNGIQTGFDIAEAVPIGQLSESHAEKLIEAGEVPDAIVSFVLADAAVEIAPRQGVHELREEILLRVHNQVLSTVFRGKAYGIPSG